MQGRICDGGVFLRSAFYNALRRGVLNVPQSSARPGNDTPVPNVLVADDAFPLTSYPIKPYAAEVPKGSPKRVFNPYPTAFPYGNGMVLHFYQQQESSTTKTVHKVINKKLKTYV